MLRRQVAPRRNGGSKRTLSRRERSDLIRESIMNAAGLLFFERGFHGTSFEDIAEACGINKATIYYFFRAKSKLYHEILVKGMTRTLEGARPVVDSDSSPDEKLRLFVRNHISVQLTFKGYSGVGAIENRLLPTKLHKHYLAMRDEYEHMFRALLQEGIDKGRFSSNNVTLTSRFILGFLNSIIRWHNPKGKLTIEEIAEHASGFIIDGVKACEFER